MDSEGAAAGREKKGRRESSVNAGARADINPTQPAKVIIRRLSGSDSSFSAVRVPRLDFSR
jgi:hypothetical protein